MFDSIISGISALGNAAASIFNTKKTNEANADIQNSVNMSNILMQQQTNELNRELAAAQNAQNMAIAEKTNATNKDIASSVNATNKAIADENLSYQRELQDYNKALQEKIFQREDSSYQRTVNDMRAAGLSPLTMNGTNSSGEAIAMTPLRNEFNAQGYTAQGATMDRAEMKAAQIQAYRQEKIVADFNLANILYDIQSKRESLRSQKLQNDFDAWNLVYKRDNALLANINNWYDNLDRAQKYKYNQYFGLNDEMSQDERNWAIFSKALHVSDDRSDLPKFRVLDDESNFMPFNYGSYRDYSEGYERGYAIMHAADDILAKVFDGIKTLKSPKIPKGFKK